MFKLRHVRLVINRWIKVQFHGILTKKDLLNELLTLEQLEENGVLTENNRDRKIEVSTQLLQITHEEEILWKQRAKVQWLKEGVNSKFFHLTTNGKKRNFFYWGHKP